MPPKAAPITMACIAVSNICCVRCAPVTCGCGGEGDWALPLAWPGGYRIEPAGYCCVARSHPARRKIKDNHDGSFVKSILPPSSLACDSFFLITALPRINVNAQNLSRSQLDFFAFWPSLFA